MLELAVRLKAFRKSQNELDAYFNVQLMTICAFVKM